MAHLDYIDLLLVFVYASSESLLQDNEHVKQARLQNSLSCGGLRDTMTIMISPSLDDWLT